MFRLAANALLPFAADAAAVADLPPLPEPRWIADSSDRMCSVYRKSRRDPASWYCFGMLPGYQAEIVASAATPQLLW